MSLGWLIHDPLTRLVAQVAAIIVVSRALGLVTRRIGQPGVIAEIVAGILLGPSLVGWIWPETSRVLFAPESLVVLSLVSDLGLIFFMFLVGLELDPTLLQGRGRASVIISHTSIVVPFGLGTLLAIYLYPRLAEPRVSFSSFALFIGVAMSITAFPVLARILSERRLLRTRIGAVTIAVAAVDDVTAWCLLAFVVAAARSRGAESAILTTVLALSFVVVMFWVVRPLLRRLAARVAGRDGLTQDVVAVVMLLLLASAWATQLIGIHALFGAFLFGAILPKDGGFARALAEKLEDLVIVVLLPLFFAFSGVRTQIRLIDTPEAWGMCGLVILVACVGKFGGSAIPARLTGLTWRESSAVGILINTRGLMELIVLNIGLDLGVISPTLFAMMVVMALVTTFMTTPILQLVYPQAVAARELLVEPTRPALADTTTLREAHVLVCIEHDRWGAGLVTVASALRDREREGDVYALNLVAPTDRASFYMETVPEEAAAVNLRSALARAKELALDLKPMSFVSTDPAADIGSVAHVKDAELVLMGWHKPVLSRSLLGGTVQTVMREASSDVAVLIDRGLERIGRVLVLFQRTPHGRTALALARRVLRATGAEITLLHVHRPSLAAAAAELQSAADDLVRDEGTGRVLVRIVAHDSPTDVALEESAKGYDLVVAGVGQESGRAPQIFGAQEERLMRGSRASLLVVRQGIDGSLARRAPPRSDPDVPVRAAMIG